MSQSFPKALENILQKSQQQLYRDLLALAEQHTTRDQSGQNLRSLGLTDLPDTNRPQPIGNMDCGFTETPRPEPLTAAVPEQAVSGRRSLTYDLAKKASTRSEAERTRQHSFSIMDALMLDVAPAPSWLGRFVSSWKFEAFFAAVILTNSIFIGVVLQWESENRSASMPDAVYAVSMAYGMLFTVELLLRMVAAGPRNFYCGNNWAWNLFDTLVVASVFYEFLTDVATGGGQSTSMSGNLRILRVVRLTRLTRIVRILRVARFLRPLRTLVQSILGTLKALIWAMLLLALINYVFSIIFTDVVGNFSVDFPHEDDETLQNYFGTLQYSSLTLFMSISGGLSWFDAVQPLQKISWLWVYVFCCYVAFCLFALLNVMTGVFCHSAIKGAERDAELAVQSLMMDRQRLEDMLSKLFRKMDDDGSGRLDIAKFESYFQDEEVRAVFEALDIAAHDAWTLFQSLDHNEDHHIEVGEFMDGCERLRGPAKAVDLFALRTQITKTRKEIECVAAALRNVSKSVAKHLSSQIPPSTRISL
mmetsp:Transcript_13108/g.31267  ORF Transcript_13108/g.31267 Transcript_13108/m.31267 type:complete len:532 (-) Transcript_13108:301-1896(-)